MHVLGINCFSHDTAAAILRDGELLAFAEEERFNRDKHTKAFPDKAIAYCLETAGVGIEEVQHVAFSFRPWMDLGRATISAAQSFPLTSREYATQFAIDARLRYRVWDFVRRYAYRGEVHLVGHHESHIASSYLVSPFDEAAILSIDRGGDYLSTMLAAGRDNRLEILQTTRNPHSVGEVYSAVTAFLGFLPNCDEGKVMGLAPYGQSIYMDELHDIIHLLPGGRFRVNLDYFTYHLGGHTRGSWVSEKFIRIFGLPREPESGLGERDRDLAASVQKMTELAGVHLAEHLYEQTHAKHLCITGGVALNSVMNAAILNRTGFKDIYVQPAAGDAGTALGAAYYTWNVILDRPRTFVMEHAYWGPEYHDDATEKLLREAKLSFTKEADPPRKAAQLLSEGKIVGWFQGRVEAGPRALGNRSILADPRRAEMKDIVNAEVKHREGFRPYAPSVLEEDGPDYFEDYSPEPFMLKVLPIKKEKQSVIPAVTHTDGTGRIQTVTREQNPLYYHLIGEFKALTGVPVVLNTSFNVRGEPIVQRPEEALKMFFTTGMDALFLGPYLVVK